MGFYSFSCLHRISFIFDWKRCPHDVGQTPHSIANWFVCHCNLHLLAVPAVVAGAAESAHCEWMTDQLKVIDAIDDCVGHRIAILCLLCAHIVTSRNGMVHLCQIDCFHKVHALPNIHSEFIVLRKWIRCGNDKNDAISFPLRLLPQILCKIIFQNKYVL